MGLLRWPRLRSQFPWPARDAEVLASTFLVSALGQCLSGCFKVISINSHEMSTLFMQQTVCFFTCWNLRAGPFVPMCASVAVHQDISQGRQPKTHRDLSFGYEQLWSVGNANTWSVTVSSRLPLGESASLVLRVSENTCRCVSQGRREGRPGARIGKYFVFKFPAASCCFGWCCSVMGASAVPARPAQGFWWRSVHWRRLGTLSRDTPGFHCTLHLFSPANYGVSHVIGPFQDSDIFEPVSNLKPKPFPMYFTKDSILSDRCFCRKQREFQILKIFKFEYKACATASSTKRVLGRVVYQFLPENCLWNITGKINIFHNFI